MLGLRSRVAVVFGVLSMLVAILVALGIYLISRTYLTNQRESVAVSQALLDARSVDSAVVGGLPPGEAVTQVPVVGTSQAFIQVGGEWFKRGTTVSPSEISQSLIDVARSTGGAQQMFAVGQQTYFAVGVDTPSGLYVEMFPMDDLSETLTKASLLLVILAVLAFVVGGGVGRWVGDRLMRPLERLGAGARRLADGDLSVRLPDTGDRDLDPISDSFNEMAVAVASRIERERRFVANVSHELRSPMTTVVATAELLESHRSRFSERDSRLVSALAGQVRRLSTILLDLLEISSVNAAAPIQRDATDLAALVEAVLVARGIDPAVLVGDHPVVVTDARRVERVMANLIDNAGRHGGGLRRVVVVADGLLVLCHVDDAGPGIAADQAERLFEPFARGSHATEAGIEGAGLGLAIAREQAAAIGGRLSVSRSPYGGARMTLALPAEVAP